MVVAQENISQFAHIQDNSSYPIDLSSSDFGNRLPKLRDNYIEKGIRINTSLYEYSRFLQELNNRISYDFSQPERPSIYEKTPIEKLAEDRLILIQREGKLEQNSTSLNDLKKRIQLIDQKLDKLMPVVPESQWADLLAINERMLQREKSRKWQDLLIRWFFK